MKNKSSKRPVFIALFSILALVTAGAAILFSSGILFKGQLLSMKMEPTLVPPRVTIEEPTHDGDMFSYNSEVRFVGHATDVKGAILPSSSLKWSSSIDGTLGTGDDIRKVLSKGKHTITLSTSDGDGTSNIATRIINVTNMPAAVRIINPVPDSYFKHGQLIEFAGSAVDPENQEIPAAAFIWKSNKDGLIGRGKKISTSKLSEGLHVITLSVSDAAGNESAQFVQLVIVK